MNWAITDTDEEREGVFVEEFFKGNEKGAPTFASAIKWGIEKTMESARKAYCRKCSLKNNCTKTRISCEDLDDFLNDTEIEI